MVFKKKEFKLKDGRKAVLHTPSEDDAEDMLQFIVKASSETDFLMRFPEELAEVTLDQERAFIQESYDSENRMMIICFVDGRIAGSCQISFVLEKKIVIGLLLRLPFCKNSGILVSEQECLKRCFKWPELVAMSVRLNLTLLREIKEREGYMKKWDFGLQE